MPGLPSAVPDLSPVVTVAKPPVVGQRGARARVIPVIHSLYIYNDLIYKFLEEDGFRKERGGVITRLLACLRSPIMALPEMMAATLPAEAES